MPNDLAQNLKYLCAEKPSVAMVCREIGINHQQFSKYLTGRSKPSAHNLRRIAQYFGLSETNLAGSHANLTQIRGQRTTSPAAQQHDPLADAFPGDLKQLRPFLGAYQIYFRAPVVPNGYIVNTIFLDERDGIVYSRLIEALPSPASGHRRWTRCDGKVSYQNGRIFVVDSERHGENALSTYILTPPPRQKSHYLFGTMCYLASMPRRTPYASKVVWRRFENYKSVKELFQTCGMFSAENLRLDPIIKKYLSGDLHGTTDLT
ncbi:Helix-turn-helix domain protein [Roseovarius albus]|uniref:Helix-turn-helix domain protein n=2 Tax=Roseovarius albus TaxID=1247867 RepID=A0A1X6ZN02_9RHOB|nr:Helix-turn-helix domain protein [Roseovarius albus]